MTTMRIDDLQVFSVHLMCSNVRNTSMVHLRMFSPDLWIIATRPPLPVGRGVCFIAYLVGVRSFLTKASVDVFNQVSHSAIISKSFSRM